MNQLQRFTQSLDSRKLMLVYISCTCAVIVSFVTIGRLPSPEMFLSYFADPNQVSEATLVGIHIKYTDSVDSIIASLFIFCGSVVAGYMGANVWQKRVEGKEEYKAPDLSDPEPDHAQSED